MKYLADRDLAERYGIARPSVWRWAKTQPSFPAPIKLSPGCTRWRLDDVERWEADRAKRAEMA